MVDVGDKADGCCWCGSPRHQKVSVVFFRLPFWAIAHLPHVGESCDKRRTCIHPSSMTTVPFYPFPPRLPFPLLSAPLSLFTCCLPVLMAVNCVRLETNGIFPDSIQHAAIAIRTTDISCLYWSIAIFGLFSSDCSQSPPDRLVVLFRLGLASLSS